MMFTIFTPTYNREYLLHRVFDSLMKQTYRDFEWIIIDDGSTDNTSDIIELFKAKANFKIISLKQKNKGKVASINTALDIANGEWFLVFDSDDWCADNALERFIHHWNLLSEKESDSYSSMSSLKVYTDGQVVGEDYSRLPYKGKTYQDRFNLRIKGDKWECIKTSAHRRFRYELALGERYMAPEYAWLAIGQESQTIFINEPLSIIEYQPDGISVNNLKHRLSSLGSTIRFYHRALDVAKGPINKAKARINLGRFYLHNKSFIRFIVTSNIFCLLSLVYFFYDKANK